MIFFHKLKNCTSKVIFILIFHSLIPSYAGSLCLKHYTPNEISNSFYILPQGLLTEAKDLLISTLAYTINYYMNVNLTLPRSYNQNSSVFHPSKEAIHHAEIIANLPASKIDDYLNTHFKYKFAYKGAVESYVREGTKSVEELNLVIKSLLTFKKLSDFDLKKLNDPKQTNNVLNLFLYHELLELLQYLNPEKFIVTVKWTEVDPRTKKEINRSVTTNGVPIHNKTDVFVFDSINSENNKQHTVPFGSITKIEVTENTEKQNNE